jgi:hypothetical protein
MAVQGVDDPKILLKTSKRLLEPQKNKFDHQPRYAKTTLSKVTLESLGVPQVPGPFSDPFGSPFSPGSTQAP